jgi:hypothetical protein
MLMLRLDALDVTKGERCFGAAACVTSVHLNTP